MTPTGGIRSAFLTAGIEAAADAYLADCREVLLASDPTIKEVTHPQLIQAMVSMAMQRMMHWSALHRGEDENPELIPGQALLGAFTGIGISVAMFEYDPENVLQGCVPAMMRAWGDAIAMMANERADASTVN